MTHHIRDSITVINQPASTDYLTGQHGTIVGPEQYRICHGKLCVAYSVEVAGEVISLTAGEIWTRSERLAA